MNTTNKFIVWDINRHSLIIRINQERLDNLIIPEFFQSRPKFLKAYEEYEIQFPLPKEKQEASLLVFLESFLTYQVGELMPNIFLWIPESDSTAWVALSPEFLSFIKGIAPIKAKPENKKTIEKEMKLAQVENTVFRVLLGGNFSMQADENAFIISSRHYSVNEQKWNVYYTTTHRTTRQSLAFIIGLAMISSAMQGI